MNETVCPKRYCTDSERVEKRTGRLTAAGKPTSVPPFSLRTHTTPRRPPSVTPTNLIHVQPAFYLARSLLSSSWSSSALCETDPISSRESRALTCRAPDQRDARSRVAVARPKTSLGGMETTYAAIPHRTCYASGESISRTQLLRSWRYSFGVCKDALLRFMSTTQSEQCRSFFDLKPLSEKGSLSFGGKCGPLVHRYLTEALPLVSRAWRSPKISP